jgi:hypothetical protein
MSKTRLHRRKNEHRQIPVGTISTKINPLKKYKFSKDIYTSNLETY